MTTRTNNFKSLQNLTKTIQTNNKKTTNNIQKTVTNTISNHQQI